MKQHLIRHHDLIHGDALNVPVTIIGCGAIGSWTALQLAKLGFENLTICDHDVVAIENVSCQLFGEPHLNLPKVTAMKEILELLTAADTSKMTFRYEKWTPDPANTKGIVILAVDCMEARRAIFEEIKRTHIFVKHVIDCRMGAEGALMFVMNPFDEKDFKSYIESTKPKAPDVKCTSKATGYTASLISGWAVKAVKNLATRQPYTRLTFWDIAKAEMEVTVN